MNVLTPVHGRRPLTALVLDYYRELRNEGLLGEHIVIATEDEDAALAESFGCVVVRAPNEPLGDKFNAGIERATATSDRVMVSGSDAVVSRSYTRFVQSVNAPWFCPCSLGEPGLYYFDYWVSGTGQIITRDAWERVGLSWYAPQNAALDASLQSRMAAAGIAPVMIGQQRMFGMGILTIKIRGLGGITPMQAILDRHEYKRLDLQEMERFGYEFANKVRAL